MTRENFPRRDILKLALAAGVSGVGIGASDDKSIAGAAELDVTQSAKLFADDGEPGDFFGHAVALSDSTALVGAREDETSNGSRAGSAYVFTERDGEWRQQAKLIPDDNDPSALFGSYVALSGSTALIGTGLGDAAYVFTERDGEWRQMATLRPDDDGRFNDVGDPVALSGSTALIGADKDDPNDGDTGMAYVFTERDGEWRQQAMLTPSDGDGFGDGVISMALSGSTALIGRESAGVVSVFSERDGKWRQQTTLTPAENAADTFGYTVALSGSTALIGTDAEDDNSESVGAAYVFTERDGEWRQQATLSPDNGEPGDDFGVAVALNKTTALIGARGAENASGEPAGAAYVFAETDEGWAQRRKLTADDGDTSDLFGASVALADTTALVGALADETPNGELAGSAYIFNIGTVEAPSGGLTAAFDVSPAAPTTGEPVTLDATPSSAPGGTIQTYEWDIGGDGVFDATGQQIERVFDRIGEVEVTLRVIYGAGNTATASQQVAVALDGREEKLQLAGQIDEISITGAITDPIPDVPPYDTFLARRSLRRIEQGVNTETIPGSTAATAVDRLIGGERMTVQTLKYFGPAGGEQFPNYARIIMRPAVSLLAELIVAKTRIGEYLQMKLDQYRGYIENIRTAEDIIDYVIETYLSQVITDENALTVLKTQFTEEITAFTQQIVDEAVETVNQVETLFQDMVDRLLDIVVVAIRIGIEVPSPAFLANEYGVDELPDKYADDYELALATFVRRSKRIFLRKPGVFDGVIRLHNDLQPGDDGFGTDVPGSTAAARDARKQALDGLDRLLRDTAERIEQEIQRTDRQARLESVFELLSGDIENPLQQVVDAVEEISYQVASIFRQVPILFFAGFATTVAIDAHNRVQQSYVAGENRISEVSPLALLNGQTTDIDAINNPFEGE